MPDNIRTEENIRAPKKKKNNHKPDGSFKRIGSCTYLVIDCPESVEDDSVNTVGVSYSYCQCMMLQNCKISGFLPFRMIEADGRKQFYYNITSAIPLHKFLDAKTINAAELLSILNQLLLVVRQCAGYLLDSGSIMLEPEFVYVDPFDVQMKFVHFPVKIENDITEKFRKLALWIIDGAHIAKEKEGEPNIVSGIKTILGNELFDISRFAAEIEKTRECADEEKQAKKTQSPEKSAFSDTGRKRSEKPMFFRFETAMNGLRNIRTKQAKESIAATNEQTGALYCEKDPGSDFSAGENRGKEERTMLLCGDENEEKADKAHETEVGENHKTRDNTTAFLRNLSGDVTFEIQAADTGCMIGRKKDLADLIISNKTIGKIHAEIIRKSGEYYIKDLNSRNGTCVNNIRIDPGTEVKLTHRDILTFANEDYIFVISHKNEM
ncbi:MAG: DUF6382 domain-containing protein [Eubacteriales bacterium]|nr:DUF6382 domain-containing protein [Eubacteriales bacterium]